MKYLVIAITLVLVGVGVYQHEHQYRGCGLSPASACELVKHIDMTPVTIDPNGPGLTKVQ